MLSINPHKAWRSFLALPNTSPLKTVGIAFLVALVCSVVVSLTAVTLKPLQEANRLRESAASLIGVLEALGADIPKKRLVARSTGNYVYREAVTQTKLDSDLDIAGLGQVEDVLTVYELRTGEQLELLILPVRGAGHISVMKGYLALNGDLNTIAALTFHQQDETPGMGARIVEKEWQALWADKQITDENGIIRIEVVKGEGEGVHEVDGISGATRTGMGITNLMRFWLGPEGYGPYLARLKGAAGS